MNEPTIDVYEFNIAHYHQTGGITSTKYTKECKTEKEAYRYFSTLLEKHRVDERTYYLCKWKFLPPAKRLDSQPVPVEPEIVKLWRENPTVPQQQIIEYIDTLLSELKRVTEERDNATTLLKQWKEEGNHLFCQTCDSCGIDDCCPPNQCWQTRAEAAESELKRRTEEHERVQKILAKEIATHLMRAESAESLNKQCKSIAWDWGQGVTDAETAIRQLHKLFPIDAELLKEVK